MCGGDASLLIRKQGYTGKIYGVTGNALPSDIEAFLRHGVNRVFLKPMSSDDLQGTVIRLYLLTIMYLTLNIFNSLVYSLMRLKNI
jgi:CheY-like chemotaxis protein